MIKAQALVLFSGGQDSTICLAWALNSFERVETVGFDYGQRHAAELMARPRLRTGIAGFAQWADRLGQDHVIALSAPKAIGGSALTSDMAIAVGRDGLPTTFVPGRNLMFLAVAAALGYRREISDLVGGMCETDFSGYPDCRDETLKAMAKTLSLGLGRATRIHAPLMFLDKAASWKLAETLGGRALVDLIVEESVTCYHGDRSARHSWGYGCGECPACMLRANGYAKYQAA
ncbi:MAG: 7-cyano-7-deazaguanine synthase QueC [Rhizomicrobium sp.]